MHNESCFVSFTSISMKELKALLPLINYKAPNSRVLKDKVQVPNFCIRHVLIIIACSYFYNVITVRYVYIWRVTQLP